MADLASYGSNDQAILTLKKGTQLLKYCRKGKPKFRTFRLSTDETTLIWYSKGEEKYLKLSSVSRIIPGQRTPVFQRFYCPDKEYLSFSLIHSNDERSLDLICKDKVESEIWLNALKALISTYQPCNRRTRSEIPEFHGNVTDNSHENRALGSNLEGPFNIFQGRFSTDSISRDIRLKRSGSFLGSECSNMQTRTSGDGGRISVSSSSSGQYAGLDDTESLGDVYMWGEICIDGLGPGTAQKSDVLLPKQLESNVVIDVIQISCGVSHKGLVTRQGEVFTWGEEYGGRLGHGNERDLSSPKLIESLSVSSIEFISCGEFHSCAISASGDLHTWGDGVYNAGLLGHDNDVSHWIPKRVSRSLEGIQVTAVDCGSWHTAVITSTGGLLTFGDGAFGALGHGDRENARSPKIVQALNGLRTLAVSCGMWHTAALVEVASRSGAHVSSRKLFTWGDGDDYQLGHGNKNTFLIPTCVSSLIDYNIHQISCGSKMTVVLTTSGHVFTMGRNDNGQLGTPKSSGKLPGLVQDGLVGEFVEQIACGQSHVAVLTSRSELFTWGKGANGRLGHGDLEDVHVPKLVEALKDRQVRHISCGSNYTTTICMHRWTAGSDQSVCTSCRQAFGFTRKRRNCYHCGLVHCHACSSKKALRAALAPTPEKPHRVCDSCYQKLKRTSEVSRVASLTRRSLGPRRFTEFSNRNARASRVLFSHNVEPVKYLEVKSGMQRASQVPSALKLRDAAFPSSLSASQFAMMPTITSSAYTSQSQSSSRSTSPFSRRPSPPRSPSPVFSRGNVDTLKRTNDLLNQEVSKLHGEVKSLKHKTDSQCIEIQKLKEAAQEANSLVAFKSSECDKVMQAFKTITNQLKEIKQKMPLDTSENQSFETVNAQVDSLLDTIQAEIFLNLPQESSKEERNHADHKITTGESSAATEEQVDSGNQVTPKSLSGTPTGINSSSDFHRRTDSQSIIEGSGLGAPEAPNKGYKEAVEQFEPGVYVTLVQLVNGSKVFKRVQFSKRHFSEQQAAEWWKENKDRLLKKYSPPKITKPATTEDEE